MEIRPLPGYALVEPIEEETKTSGGLYVPETDKNKPCKGKVIKLSSLAVMSLKPDTSSMLWADLVHEGQTVFYKRFVNQEVEHEGKKYLLINFSELLAVLE